MFVTQADANGYSVRDNFVTGNAYLCVELNVHSFISIFVNVINGDTLSVKIKSVESD